MLSTVPRTRITGRRCGAGLACTAALLSALALSGPAGAAQLPAGGTSPFNPTESSLPGAGGPQGFIMSDGRICNPRWGC